MAQKLRHLRRAALTLGLLLPILLVFMSCLSNPTPSLDTLVYKGPVEISVEPDEHLPGTDILYVGITNGMAEFEIEGQRALKKIGDSLDWHGTPIDGVELDLGLRVLLMTDQTVHAGGTITIKIDQPTPRESALDTASTTKFSVPVTYGVKPGDNIPGTLISYEEQEEGKGARLGGIKDYPYRKTGDSVVWEGKLQDNVALRLDLRVLFFNDNTLRVGGVATLWLEK